HDDRHVATETKGIKPVDPDVVARLCTTCIRDVPQLRPGKLIELPALGAMFTRCCGSVENLALATVKTCKMTARERYPVDAIAIDVAAARAITGQKWLVDFRARRLCWIGAQHCANNRAGITDYAAPNRTVYGAHGNCIFVDGYPFVLRGIDRLVGFNIRTALPISDGVDNEGR